MNKCCLCLVLQLRCYVSKHPALGTEKVSDRLFESWNELKVCEHEDAAVNNFAKTHLLQSAPKQTKCHALHGQDAEV